MTETVPQIETAPNITPTLPLQRESSPDESIEDPPGPKNHEALAPPEQTFRHAIPLLRLAPDLLVVIPYYNRPETIQRAVSSVLSQTSGNLRLLIVDDASDVPARDVVAPDSQLRFFRMKQNVGRYFIDAVGSRANPYPFYMPHDSDDESVPDRVSILKERMDHGDVDVVYNLEHRIQLDGTEKTMPAEPFYLPLDREKMVHRAHHSALYRSPVLLETAGYHPGYRVGYDTFLINALKIAARTEMVPAPLYIRHKTEVSLTESPETGHDSPHRLRTRQVLRKLFHRCFDNPADTNAIIERSIPHKTKSRMNSEIRRMKEEIDW